MRKYTSSSEAETTTLAADLLAQCHAGQIITLTGDLGAGKTTFTKGIAQALGVHQEITSPTFAIMNVYDTSHPNIKKLVHIDTYRLKSTTELIGIGAEDYIGAPDTLTIIEWPELAAPLLAEKDQLEISLAHQDSHTRIITVRETKTGTI